MEGDADVDGDWLALPAAPYVPPLIASISASLRMSLKTTASSMMPSNHADRAPLFMRPPSTHAASSTLILLVVVRGPTVAALPAVSSQSFAK